MFLWLWYWDNGTLALPPIQREDEEEEEFGGLTTIWRPLNGRILEEDEAILMAAIL